MASARTYPAAVALDGGRALVAGGLDRESEEQASAELYDDAEEPQAAIAERRVEISGSRTDVRVVCSGPSGASCTATLTLRPTLSTSRVRRATSTSTRFRVPAGQSRAIRVKVPRPTRTRLRARRRAAVRAVVRQTGQTDAAVERLLTVVRR
jgi:hypothetical protein